MRSSRDWPRPCGRRDGRAGSDRLALRATIAVTSPRSQGTEREEPAMIDLHYWPTPNGKKVTILLEELGLEYRVVPCNIGCGDQFQADFLAISPNNRMPALVDHLPKGGGEPLSVFESGAMLMYLADKAGRFWPDEPHAHWDVAQWVVWQMANQGPKLGENGHFRRLGDREGDQSYALRRFDDEANRIFGVMNCRLYDHPYLAADEYSIADIASYPWAVGWERQGQDIAQFPHVQRWIEELGKRPAVERGMNVGSNLGEDYSKLSKDEIERRMKLLYNQRARSAPDAAGA
jgi:GST-like protein